MEISHAHATQVAELVQIPVASANESVLQSTRVAAAAAMANGALFASVVPRA